MITRWKLKQALMKADSVIDNDEADYLADELYKTIQFDFSMEATFGLMVMCLWIGWMLGHLK